VHRADRYLVHAITLDAVSGTAAPASTRDSSRNAKPSMAQAPWSSQRLRSSQASAWMPSRSALARCMRAANGKCLETSG
jgi:hypothetical protein